MSDQQSNEQQPQQGDQQPGKKRRRRRRGRRNAEGGTPGEQGAEDQDVDSDGDDDAEGEAPRAEHRTPRSEDRGPRPDAGAPRGENAERDERDGGDAEGEGDENAPSKKKRRRKKKRDGQGDGQQAPGDGQRPAGGEQRPAGDGQRSQGGGQRQSGNDRREKREQQKRERAERPAQPSVLQRRLSRIRSENDVVDDDAPVAKAPVVVNATTVDGYVSAHRGWQREVLSTLRDLIRAAAPGCDEGILWSQPVFSMNGPMVYIKAFSDHVNIGFWRGNELDDPADMLVGDLPKMRHYTMRSVNDVKRDILENMVRQAAKLNRDKGDPTS